MSCVFCFNCFTAHRDNPFEATAIPGHCECLCDGAPQGTRLSAAQVVDILRQCIAGLRHLHEENDIIHRDVRSANIMVDAKKGSLRVVLADFGISHHLSMKRLSVADKRHLIGPVWWIAPEVLSSATNHGTVPVTTASDVYMLGGLMFEVLNGGNRPYWWSHEE